jgi:hypothetical protein
VSAHLYVYLLFATSIIYCYFHQAPLYNCSLALYYLLVIKFNWTNDKLVKIERYVHGFIITFAVGTSIAGLPLTMYNKVTSVCWVIGHPSECGNSSSNPSDVPCERGDWAWLFGIILFYGPLWVCVLLTIIAMTLIYMQVRNAFKKNEKYRFQGDNDHSHARRPSVMNNNLRTATASAAVGGPTSGVITDTATSESTQPPNGNDTQQRSVDVAGQILCARMSRISAFEARTPTDMKELEEIDAAMAMDEREDMDEQQQEVDSDDNSACAEEMKEELSELPPQARNAYTLVDSEVSGGIGLKSGYYADTAARKAANGPTQTKATSSRLSIPRRIASASARNKTRAQQKQNLFAIQAILYSGSFFITWTPSTIWSVAYWFGVGGIGFDIAAATCEPLQGFWNMLIFIRSRPTSQEKLRRVFGSFCCFWLCLLPKMQGSLDRSSSRAFSSSRMASQPRLDNSSRKNNDSTASGGGDSGTRERGRRRSSNIQLSQDSMQEISACDRVGTTEMMIPEEQEQPAAFGTEPISGDDLSK